MSCGIDLTSMPAAVDACLAIIYSTPDWALKLAYGVATLSLFLLAITLVLMVIVRVK